MTSATPIQDRPLTRLSAIRAEMNELAKEETRTINAILARQLVELDAAPSQYKRDSIDRAHKVELAEARRPFRHKFALLLDEEEVNATRGPIPVVILTPEQRQQRWRDQMQD